MTFAEEQDDSFISATLSLNDTLIPSVSSYSINQQAYAANSDDITVSISNDRMIVSVNLVYNGVSRNVDLYGNSMPVDVGGTIGYIGVYEGILILSEDYESISVIADAIFSNSEIFVALTFGVSSKTSSPAVCLYGELSPHLLSISNEYVYSTLASKESSDMSLTSTGNISSTSAVNTVDGVIRYQGQSIFRGGENDNYIFGYINSFHANEMRIQGNSPVKVKINTNTSDVMSYLRNELGYSVANYNVFSVNADKIEVSISSGYQHYILATSGYEPKNRQTSFTLPVPYVNLKNPLEPMLSITEITINTSSTSVTTGTTSASHTNLNKVSWVFEAYNGFGTSEFDGTVLNNSSGLVVTADYTYAGSSSTPITTDVIVSGNIRYRYYVQVSNSDYIVLHLMTGTNSLWTDIRVVPE